MEYFGLLNHGIQTNVINTFHDTVFNSQLVVYVNQGQAIALAGYFDISEVPICHTPFCLMVSHATDCDTTKIHELLQRRFFYIQEWKLDREFLDKDRLKCIFEKITIALGKVNTKSTLYCFENSQCVSYPFDNDRAVFPSYALADFLQPK